MTEEDKERMFWHIIEIYKSVEMIEDMLSLLEIEENMFFDVKLREKLHILIKPKIAEVFLAVYNHKAGSFEYISNDGFLDFRAWIVQQGREVFNLFLNFSSEKELLHLDLHPDVVYSEDLLYVVLNTLEKKMTKEEFDKLEYIPNTGVDDVEEHSRLYSDVEFDKISTKYPVIFSRYNDDL